MFGIKHRPRRRAAVPGELCLCGHQAEIVLDDPRLGPVFGSCLARYDHPRYGPCPFCGQHTRHATAADCTSYTLRPAWAEPAAQAAPDRSAASVGVVHHVAEEAHHV